jgi:hypothetical protein
MKFFLDSYFLYKMGFLANKPSQPTVPLSVQINFSDWMPWINRESTYPAIQLERLIANAKVVTVAL